MVDEGRPPVTVELAWDGHLQFGATLGDHRLVIDGDGAAGPSPMQLVAAGLAGCMAVDVVHILTRGRHEVKGLSARLTAERATGTPAFYTRIGLHVVLTGDMPGEAVERALRLSRDTYCSAWHSLRPDIELTATFEVVGLGTGRRPPPSSP